MILVLNKRASYEYEIEKKYQAGIVLSGAEVKSLRLKQASLNGSHVAIINGEAVLLNAQINAYKFAKNDNYEPKRTRQLLLHKKEIAQLQAYSQEKGRAIVPLAMLLQGNRIKLEIGAGRGKKLHEKREVIKKRDLARDEAKERKFSPH